MKLFKFALGVACTLLSVNCFADAAITLTTELNQTTKKTLSTWMNDYGLPSLSMAVAIDGEIVFAEAVGFADVDNKRRATPQTQYSVGSIAKAMTGLALMRMVDKEKISLNASVYQRVPEFPEKSWPMTVQQLASHTAGIGRPWSARNQLEFKTPKDHTSPLDVLSIFANDPLKFEPGSDFQYTSMGYVLLSAVIEKASSASYLDVMKDEVWLPLGMSRTEFDDSHLDPQSEAVYYEAKQADGKYLLAPKPRDRSYLFGAGGFVSTPSDLVKLSLAWSQEDYLSSDSKNALMTPIALVNGEINPQKYSLGWRVGELEVHNQTVSAVHHGGVTWKAATGFVFIVPEYNAAIAYTTNMSPNAFGEVRSEAAQILANYIETHTNKHSTK